MDIEFLFETKKTNPSTKFLIIKILLIESNLKNSQIQNKLKQIYNKKISFQAVRQALKELVNDNVLKEDNRKYFINPEWENSINDFSKLIKEEKYKQKIKLLLKKELNNIQLNNLAELGYFILYLLELIVTEQNKNIYFFLNHLWIPFGDNKERLRLSNILKKRCKIFIKENTTGDKILAYWYKKHGELKLKNKSYDVHQYIIYEDLIIQIFMSDKILEFMKKTYSLKNVLTNNLYKSIIDLTYNSHKIEINFLKNQELANKLKKIN